jgi:hypothetical protein
VRARGIRVRPTNAVVLPQITTHPSYLNWFVGPPEPDRRARPPGRSQGAVVVTDRGRSDDDWPTDKV